jgi:archaellum component FlaC
LPAGVSLSKMRSDDIDDLTKPTSVKSISPINKKIRQINDVEPLIKNIETNMTRLQQGVADVKRALKDIDEKSGTNNLEKFSADYDKLKSEVENAKYDFKTNPTSESLYQSIKSLSTKIAIAFGNNFYKIKKAIPGQLNGNVWTFSDPKEAPKPPEAPIAAPKPIIAPKVSPKKPEDDAEKWLAANKDALGDDEFANDTRPRHQEYDESPIRETIRKYFS